MVLFGVCSLLLSVNSIIAAFYTGSGAHQMGSWQAKLACVAWRFWLGAPSNKGGRGQRNRVEIGAGAIFIFLAASPFVLARLAREFRGPRFRRSCARLDKTAMLRRLRLGLSLRNCLPPPPPSLTQQCKNTCTTLPTIHTEYEVKIKASADYLLTRLIVFCDLHEWTPKSPCRYRAI